MCKTRSGRDIKRPPCRKAAKKSRGLFKKIFEDFINEKRSRRPGFNSRDKSLWWDEYCGICAICGFYIKSEIGYHGDHSIPDERLVKAGYSYEDYANVPVFPTCPKCNMDRSNNYEGLAKYLANVTVPISKYIFVKASLEVCQEILREYGYVEGKPLTAIGFTCIYFKEQVVQRYTHRNSQFTRCKPLLQY